MFGSSNAERGNLCRYITQRYPHWKRIQMEQLLEAERAQKGPTAVLIDSYLKQNKAVPRQVVCSVLKAELMRQGK